MDILEIRKRARARSAQQAATESATATTAAAARGSTPAAAASAPPPSLAPTSAQVGSAPSPRPARPVTTAEAGRDSLAPLPASSDHGERPREPLPDPAAPPEDADALDDRILAEFFASDRDAAINRFADPTLFTNARGFARSSADSVRYLTCRVGTEEYGVELSRTREILKPLPLTLVPRAPAEVLGVISLRGRVLPVVDLSSRLGAATVPRGARGERYVVLQVQGEVMCVRVDAVSGVVGFSPAEIEPAPRQVRGVDSDAVAGIGRIEERMIILLRIDELVNALLREYG